MEKIVLIDCEDTLIVSLEGDRVCLDFRPENGNYEIFLLDFEGEDKLLKFLQEKKMAREK